MGKSYDVIIIGAGPGGLECARGFADKEMSVLVIEKNDIVGPKTCGGALTNLTEKFNIPDKITETFQAIKLEINRDSIDLDLKKPIRTVSRSDLGQYLLNILRSSKTLRSLQGQKLSQFVKGKFLPVKRSFLTNILSVQMDLILLYESFSGLKVNSGQVCFIG